MVELGSGTSDKTRLLLDAFADAGRLERFVPVDVSEETLREAADTLAARYPETSVEAVVGDFTLHLGHLARYRHKLVAFLGGTIGNLYVEERGAFLGALADSMDEGDELLLGTDLVKDADRLITAYDDPGGVTEAFVKNSLRVLNRELDADFDVDAFSYVPFWDRRMQRMDLRLRAEMPQHVTVPGADLELDLASGEEIRVEISTKFTAGAAARTSWARPGSRSPRSGPTPPTASLSRWRGSSSPDAPAKILPTFSSEKKSAGDTAPETTLTNPSIASWLPWTAPSSCCSSGGGGSSVASCEVNS